MRKLWFCLKTWKQINNEYNPNRLFSVESFKLKPRETVLFLVDCQQVTQQLSLKDSELCALSPPKLEQMCLLVHNLSYNRAICVLARDKLQSILLHTFVHSTLCHVDYNDLLQSSNTPVFRKT